MTKDKDVAEIFETLIESYQFILKKAAEQKKSSIVILADDNNEEAESLCFSLNAAGDMEILAAGLVALITGNDKLQMLFMKAYMENTISGMSN